MALRAENEITPYDLSVDDDWIDKMISGASKAAGFGMGKTAKLDFALFSRQEEALPAKRTFEYEDLVNSLKLTAQAYRTASKSGGTDNKTQSEIRADLEMGIEFTTAVYKRMLMRQEIGDALVFVGKKDKAHYRIVKLSPDETEKKVVKSLNFAMLVFEKIATRDISRSRSQMTSSARGRRQISHECIAKIFNKV